jgi:phage terminase large subunit GpA-like protein
VALAFFRAQTYWNRKLVMVSTPTVKDVSRIEAAYEASDQRRYYVPRPRVYDRLDYWAKVLNGQLKPPAKQQRAVYPGVRDDFTTS